MQINLSQEQVNAGQLVSNFACFVKGELMQEVSIRYQRLMLITVFAP